MQAVIHISHPGVGPIHGQQILGQVIGPDRKEIQPTGHCSGQPDCGGHLDHGPHRREGLAVTLGQHLIVAATNQRQGLLHLVHGGNHGQQYPQIAQALVGFEHRPDLGKKNLGMVQGDPDAAPTQKRVVLLYGEVGQGFVATDIEAAHCHRQGREGLQLLPIHLPLLLLTGKFIPQQERHLGAIQAHALGTALQRRRQVGGQPGINP